MKRVEGECHVGTFVFLEEAALSDRKYGVVVDADFWREKMKKENPDILGNFNKAREAKGVEILPVMLLANTFRKKIGVNLQEGEHTVEEYIQKFVWTKACYAISFNDAEEFAAVMEQISCFVGGPSAHYIHLVRSFAEEIHKYLHNSNYKTELYGLFEKAFPGLKARQKEKMIC